MENSSKLYKELFDLKNENKELKEKLSSMETKVKGLTKENKLLKTLLSEERTKNQLLEKKIKALEENMDLKIKLRVQGAINLTTQNLTEHYESIIRKLEKKIEALEKVLNTDSTNSSLPSSKNRIGKIIPNTREKSNKSKGGQKGHNKHKLDYFKEEEITEIVEHTLDKCPKCKGTLKEENIVIADVIDYEIKIKKIRNNIHNYKCNKCGHLVSANDTLPRGASYGENVKALSLSLMNESNVAINKVRKHICGITEGEINPSEGYLAKLQKQSAEKLESFIKELKIEVLKQEIVNWDDTVVKLSNDSSNDKKIKQGVIRFYGNDKLALLIGHKDKSEEGIKEDGILPHLSKNTICMHDHVLLNYNDKYKFQNAECNSHILRYLKGVKDNIHDHKWQDKLSDLLKKINEERNLLIEKKETSFSEEKIKEIYSKYNEIIKFGYEENKSTKEYHFYKDEERKLIERLDKYKDNHLLFIKDFKVPFTNNTAERGLRQCKRKLAISFMFSNTTTMENYATILSYLETCYRNNITKFEASKRLVSNNPYTINEILNNEK